MSVRDIIILGCSSQQPTRHRNHGAYLVRWNEEGLLFDPGEGTQRQFIFANVAPTFVTKIFISHFHGDHCLGLGSMLMRLNLDRVEHEIHCYYPASGKRYFDRLRYGTHYHDTIKVVEHPVEQDGLVEDDGKFKIYASFLEHGIDNIGWRIEEADKRKYDQKKLEALGVKGPNVRKLTEKGSLLVGDKEVQLDDVSEMKRGDVLAVVIDTRVCPQAVSIAKGAKVLICESTYQEEHKAHAHKNYHLTAKQAAQIAKEAGVKKLILTHFSARYLKTDQMQKEAEEIFENVEMAEDLKRIEFER